ncbi:SDR family NAD(P)-dependent oxidoreductase [Celerinatantimonas diazotrophica]|uniref:NAD(P)-dependent dehydrogenase (Short-subunit alcohol dehydrogenase family) n=1 Tax=Celerinatantimonas diazotrophica TaxID=412034 RepID=A0A4R1K3K9_9GAMM|nr:SDR family oxidoreductase [Celerinatantimonas diazotrophica]TCK58675.1 NAD(P)-dependent dehydrogenase (short-subunit alcohol dehydrogenase family) [Celerinatantimonas diazotrophica]CAG9297304.1 Levodione reductase [Celerinatantimonas diazotrophica]
MKVALVTGGSKGIGLHVVLRLVRQGIKVVTCSRAKENWLNSINEFPELNVVDYQSTDIADEQQLARLFDYIREHYEKLDMAVNNASPAIVSCGYLPQVEVSLLKETLHVDFWCQVLCLRSELKLMGSGASIVNISSVNGVRPTPNAAMYSASKHALEGLTRSVALESIRSGIRINAVAPGVTWTPRWEERQLKTPNIRDDVSEAVPIKRFGKIEEIVNAVDFLLSDQASYIVGHTLVVDGGLSLTSK